MYSTFRVKNFRGFEDLEMTDLKRINLIAGKNNTGKTSLLEAVGIYSGRYNIVVQRLQDNMDAPLLRARSSQSYLGSLPRLETVFFQFKPIQITFSAQHAFMLERNPPAELELALTPYEHVDEQSLLRISRETGGAIHQDGEFVQFRASDGDQRFLYLASTGETGYSLNWTNPSPAFPLIFIRAMELLKPPIIASWFSEFKRSKQTDLLVNALNIIEPRLIDLDLLDSGLNADIEGLPQLIPLSSMGEGMVRLTSIVLAISAAKDGVVLIDEIENGLHYSVQVDVWKAILYAAQQFSVQIFATTHSYEMIAAAQEAFKDTPDAFRYYRLDRNETSGQIGVKTLDTEKLAAADAMGLEVR